jgi:hypothetical protein
VLISAVRARAGLSVRTYYTIEMVSLRTHAGLCSVQEATRRVSAVIDSLTLLRRNLLSNSIQLIRHVPTARVSRILPQTWT